MNYVLTPHYQLHTHTQIGSTFYSEKLSAKGDDTFASTESFPDRFASDSVRFLGEEFDDLSTADQERVDLAIMTLKRLINAGEISKDKMIQIINGM